MSDLGISNRDEFNVGGSMSDSKRRLEPYCPDPDLAKDIAECEALNPEQVDTELARLKIDPQRTIDAVKKLIAEERHRRLLHVRAEAVFVALALIASVWLRAGCAARPWRTGRAARRCKEVWCCCPA